MSYVCLFPKFACIITAVIFVASGFSSGRAAAVKPGGSDDNHRDVHKHKAEKPNHTSYDCESPWWHPVAAFFGRGWTKNQAEWCCKHKNIGCPLEQKPKIPSYDCQPFMGWERAWNDSQKKWCCAHNNTGCQAPEWSSEPYHCQDGLAEWKTKWSRSKKQWCCMFDNLGCEVASVDSIVVTDSRPKKGHDDTYDCTASSHLRENWPGVQKQWCCKHYDMGCPRQPEPTTTGRSESPSSTSIPAPVSTTKVTYDCSGHGGQEETWSAEKQAWCCKNELRGCTTCDTVCFVKNQVASCRSRIEWLKQHGGAEHNQGSWSCDKAHKTVLDECAACSRCDLDDACPVRNGSSPERLSYHCDPGNANEIEAWPQPKRQWCCKHHHRGCPTTSTTTTTKAYDCSVGVQEWQTQWSKAKRTWCCKESRIGCTSCDQDCALQGISATCRERIGWLQGHDFADLENACTSARTVVLDQCKRCADCEVSDVCPGNENAPLYDCDENEQDWKQSWSDLKKRWCCQAEEKGCEQTEIAEFDCNVSLSEWQGTWPLKKMAWCCKNEQKGCAEDDIFDCQKGLSTWRTSWTMAKQKWCCENGGIGCSSHDDAPFEPYECESSQVGWTPGQKAWCCSHHSRGCGPDAESKAKYDCKGGVLQWAANWKPEKAEWCCKHFSLGCPSLPENGNASVSGQASKQNPPRYDCLLGLANWEKAWNEDKAAWCCEHRQRGCKSGSTDWMDGEAAKTASVEHSHRLQNSASAIWDIATTSTEFVSTTTTTTQTSIFHCEAVADEHFGWSDAKRRWCCKHHGRGCRSSEASPVDVVAHHGKCFQPDVVYLPLDMAGQVLNYVETVMDCQERCISTYQCAHFTYYPHEHICHISDKWSHAQTGSIGVISGPRSCLEKETTTVTWVVRDALPEVEGEPFSDLGSEYMTLDQMKDWCRGRVDCVGFAYQSGTGRWYPTRKGTGFDPRTAVWAKSGGEHWHWHYIKERAEDDGLTDMAEVTQAYESHLQSKVERHGLIFRLSPSFLWAACIFTFLLAVCGFFANRIWLSRQRRFFSRSAAVARLSDSAEVPVNYCHVPCNRADLRLVE